MSSDLARRVAELSPSVRKIVLALAAFPDHVTRGQARSRLATLSLLERSNLALDAGERRVADIANEILAKRALRKRTELQVTARTSPYAKGRNDLASRLRQPIHVRSRYRNRALIKGAAHGMWCPDIPHHCWLLVYEVEEANVGLKVNPTRLGTDRGTIATYTLYVPHDWRRQTMRVGDGTGTVSNALILSAHPVDGEGTPRSIHEVITVANWGTGELEARCGYVATWPGGCSLHGTYLAARDALTLHSPAVVSNASPAAVPASPRVEPTFRDAA